MRPRRSTDAMVGLERPPGPSVHRWGGTLVEGEGVSTAEPLVVSNSDRECPRLLARSRFKRVDVAKSAVGSDVGEVVVVEVGQIVALFYVVLGTANAVAC